MLLEPRALVSRRVSRAAGAVDELVRPGELGSVHDFVQRSGRLGIDGQDLKELDLSHLRSQIGVGHGHVLAHRAAKQKILLQDGCEIYRSAVLRSPR